MRLLIASDIHGSAAWAGRFAAKVREAAPDLVLLLGDILYHGPRNPLPENYAPAEVAAVLGELPVPVVAVRGNCDAEVDELVLPFHLAEDSWLVDQGRRLWAIHGHQLKINGGPLEPGPGEAVLFGHIHVPVAEKKGSVHYWNPGSLSLPKEDWPSSFGLYEEGRFSVLSFDGRELKTDSLG